MKKQLGILRNRHDRLIALKKEAHRKKNRFQMVGKDDFEDAKCMLSFTQLSHSPPHTPTPPVSANSNWEATRAQLRLSSCSSRPERGWSKWLTFVTASIFRKKNSLADQSQTNQPPLKIERKVRLENIQIGQLSHPGTSPITQAVMAAEGVMRQISKIEVVSSTSKKILKSMEASLAN